MATSKKAASTSPAEPVAATKVAAKPKAVTAKAAAPKVAAAPAAAKPAAAKPAAKAKAPAKKAAPVEGPAIDQAQRANYIEVAAYYIAQRRGFTPGDPDQDYLNAAAEVDQLIAAGHFSK